MVNITFTDKQYDTLKGHLFPGDGKEAVAVCLAKQIKHKDGVRLLISEVHPIPYEKCERDTQYITWATADIVNLIDEAELNGLSLIKIHSHPRGPRSFSSQDDRSDSSLFPSLKEWGDNDQIHCSVIFTDDFIIGRYFHPTLEKFLAIDNIIVIGDRLKVFSAKVSNQKECAFDELTYEVFKNLKIGIVGCSGTGSWLAELLGRNQVGRIILCDFDILNALNLTRLLNSKSALIGINKATIAAKSILEMGLTSEVEVVSVPLQTKFAVDALKGCDIIFGCVDSVFARHLLNTISTYYMIPYFDVGVHIDANETELISAAGGYHYIQPGKSSLLSRGVFTPAELAEDTYKSYSESHYDRLKVDGYVHGRKAARPAVGGLNSLSSTICFNDVESLILNYTYEDEDSIASKVVCKRSGEMFTRQETSFTTDHNMKLKLGLGDEFFKREDIFLKNETDDKPAVLERA